MSRHDDRPLREFFTDVNAHNMATRLSTHMAAARQRPEVAGEDIRRRLAGVRLVVVGATAAVLGLTPAQVAASPRKALRATATARGLTPESVRASAASAAQPLLDEAVASHVLNDAQRRSILTSIRQRGRL